MEKKHGTTKKHNGIIEKNTKIQRKNTEIWRKSTNIKKNVRIMDMLKFYNIEIDYRNMGKEKNICIRKYGVL